MLRSGSWRALSCPPRPSGICVDRKRIRTPAIRTQGTTRRCRYVWVVRFMAIQGFLQDKDQEIAPYYEIAHLYVMDAM
jgi:hypothetical protein